MIIRHQCLAIVLVLLGACADAPERGSDAPVSDAEGAGTDARDSAVAPTAPATRDMVIHYSRGDSLAPVRREVAAAAPRLEAALRELLAGPTQAERDAGISSWFSDETADYLRSETVDGSGRATIDFRDLSQVIPNATTSAGSTRLLRELNATVFEHPDVQSIDYTIEGSCDRFWDWLQYGCQRVERTAEGWTTEARAG